MFLSERRAKDELTGIWKVLFYALIGLAILYFIAYFPFPTVDFIYEDY
jgi:hypothetical protein